MMGLTRVLELYDYHIFYIKLYVWCKSSNFTFQFKPKRVAPETLRATILHTAAYTLGALVRKMENRFNASLD